MTNKRWLQARIDLRLIVVAGVAAGVTGGGVYAISESKAYAATVTLQPAQPSTLTATGGVTLLPCITSPLTTERLATSERALESAAATAQIPVSQLEGHVQTMVIRSTLVKITVTASQHDRAVDAVAALGGFVSSVTRGRYTVTKPGTDLTRSVTAYC
jgi:hypothetical protein